MTNNGNNIKSSDINTLSHTKWNCKYHIVFALKHRRKVFLENKRLEVEKILRDLCNWKGISIIEGEAQNERDTSLLAITSLSSHEVPTERSEDEARRQGD